MLKLPKIAWPSPFKLVRWNLTLLPPHSTATSFLRQIYFGRTKAQSFFSFFIEPLQYSHPVNMARFLCPSVTRLTAEYHCTCFLLDILYNSSSATVICSSTKYISQLLISICWSNGTHLYSPLLYGYKSTHALIGC